MTKLGEFFQKCLKTMSLEDVFIGYEEISGAIKNEYDDRRLWKKMVAAILESGVDWKDLIEGMIDADFDLGEIAVVILDQRKAVTDAEAFWNEVRKQWSITTDIIEAMRCYYDSHDDILDKMINTIFALSVTESQDPD